MSPASPLIKRTSKADAPMTRTTARLLAVQLTFASLCGSDVSAQGFFDDGIFPSLAGEDPLFDEKPDEKQTGYIIDLVNGVALHKDEINDIISQYSRNWSVHRISKTAIAVLQCAIYEILYMPDIPVSASINEAVELSKRFDDPEVSAFINGILGSFVRELAPDPSEIEGSGETE